MAEKYLTGRVYFKELPKIDDSMLVKNPILCGNRTDTKPAQKRRRAEEVYEQAGLPPPADFSALDSNLKFQLVRDLDRQTIQALCNVSVNFMQWCDGRIGGIPVWDRLIMWRYGPIIGARDADPLTRLRAHAYAHHLFQESGRDLLLVRKGITPWLGVLFRREDGSDVVVLDANKSANATRTMQRYIIVDTIGAHIALLQELHRNAANDPERESSYLERMGAAVGGDIFLRRAAVSNAVVRWDIISDELRTGLVTWIADLLRRGFEPAVELGVSNDVDLVRHAISDIKI